MPYDQISKGVSMLLSQLSTSLQSANEMINTPLTNNKLNIDNNFLDFVSHFDLGKYYWFRIEGYMEALVFTETFSSLDRASGLFLSDDDFRGLISETGAIKQIHMKSVGTNL